MSVISLFGGIMAEIDDTDYLVVSKYKWHLAHGYAQTVPEKGRTVLMHQLIMGKRAGFEIDHIDGNPLNNRRSNLRFVKHCENILNSKRRCDNSSGIRGISWSKSVASWEVRIQFNKKRIRYGYFKNIEDAMDELSKVIKKYIDKDGAQIIVRDIGISTKQTDLKPKERVEEDMGK